MCEIEERFGDCLDTDHSAGRGNGMSGIVAGKQPNEAERVHRSERAPRRGLDCRPFAAVDTFGRTLKESARQSWRDQPVQVRPR